MPEVSGYGPATSVVLQKPDNSTPSATTRAANVQSATQRGC